MPLEISHPKRKAVSQPPFFTGYVTFRECMFGGVFWGTKIISQNVPNSQNQRVSNDGFPPPLFCDFHIRKTFIWPNLSTSVVDFFYCTILHPKTSRPGDPRPESPFPSCLFCRIMGFIHVVVHGVIVPVGPHVSLLMLFKRL